MTEKQYNERYWPSPLLVLIFVLLLKASTALCTASPCQIPCRGSRSPEWYEHARYKFVPELLWRDAYSYRFHPSIAHPWTVLGPQVPDPGFLCACYAVSGSDVAYACTRPTECSGIATPQTDRYAPTRVLREVRNDHLLVDAYSEGHLRYLPMRALCDGTDVGYAATRQQAELH
eukprot:2606684-Rhodomonas_salina.1